MKNLQIGRESGWAIANIVHPAIQALIFLPKLPPYSSILGKIRT